MTIRFTGKVLSRVVNNAANVYYSDFRFNSLLGAGEKFFVEAKVSGVTGTAPTLSVRLETSTDNSSWVIRSTPIVPSAIQSGTVLWGLELGTNMPGGDYARFGVQLGGTNPNAYVELWVVARDVPATGTLDLSVGGAFARALVAFYFTRAPTDGATAFMVQAASGVRRMENRGDGLGASLLMEGSATNYLLNSRAMNAASWTAGTGTLTVNAANGPDGTAVAAQENAASAQYGPWAQNPGPTGNVVASIWVRAVSGTASHQIELLNSPAVARVLSVGTTYGRNMAQGNVSVNSGMITLDARDETANGGQVATAQNCYLDLPQLEAGFYPTSPINTTTAAVTRPADTLSYASGSYPAAFLTSGFVVSFAPDASSTDFIASNEDWRLVQVGANDYVRIRKNTNCVVELVCGGTVVATLTITFSRAQALMITASPTRGSLTVSGATTGNGTNVGTGAAWPSGSTLYVGGDNAGAHNVTGRYVGAAIAQA